MADFAEIKLIEAAINGDLDSFGLLCEKYYASLVAIACSILGDHHLAQDAVQTGLAKALTALPRLRNKKRFAPWLKRICRNAAKDMLSAKCKYVQTEALSQVAAPTKADEPTLAVKQAIASLPPVEREIIYLRYYNRMSYQQITDILGLSTPAINGRLKRIKRKIEKHLIQNGFAEI